MKLRLAFHLAFRQTERLMASIFDLLGVVLSSPDHSTLARRARKSGICSHRRFVASQEQFIELAASAAFENFRARYNRVFDVGRDGLYRESLRFKER
jgi:hypothetical protein